MEWSTDGITWNGIPPELRGSVGRANVQGFFPGLESANNFHRLYIRTARTFARDGSTLRTYESAPVVFMIPSAIYNNAQ
jgi:hypothetical protein